MPSRSSIVLSRRARQLDQRRARRSIFQTTGLGLGVLLAIILALTILFGALAYADLTRDLPNVDLLPALLNPPDGLLLQPTRLYDRTGQHMLFTFNVQGQKSNVENGSDAGPSTLDLRRYIPLSSAAPQHLPDFLAKATVVLADPGFWTHGGYRLTGFTNPDSHPTLAQKLVSDLLLYDEKPSLRRALRERLLAAQVIAKFGRTQVLEWVLNYADYGNYAYGIDAASQLYFGKPAADLTPAESAVLAATGQTPSLNPLDAPDLALKRGRTTIQLMQAFHLITDKEASQALSFQPSALSHPPSTANRQPSTALITSLVLHQLDDQFTRDRIQRGGLTIISTLDYDLQQGVSCTTLTYAARLAGQPDPSTPCPQAGLLPPSPTGRSRSIPEQSVGTAGGEGPSTAITIPSGAPTGNASASVGGVSIGATPAPGAQVYGSGGIVSLGGGTVVVPPTVNSQSQRSEDGATAPPSTSSLILDPQSGQILAAVGETLRGQETAFLSPHDPGTLITPFIYLTAFTRGLNPASLVWDIPLTLPSPIGRGAGGEGTTGGEGLPTANSQLSTVFHGPVRMRIALANDYLAPGQKIAAQMGTDAINRTETSFGLGPQASLQPSSPATTTHPQTLLELASAYSIFAAQGVRYGQPGPSAVLRVEGLDHSLWLDLSNPQAQPVVTPPLAYLINSILSDESARWPTLGHPNDLEIGRPSGVKLGQTASGSDSWAIGYTPTRLAAVWVGLPLGEGLPTPPFPSTANSQSQRSEDGATAPPSTPLYSALIQLATQNLPSDGWVAPPGVTTLQVCDPSGLLPTRDCPSIVTDVFLSGNEPAQPDTLFRTYTVNRETGFLATVFTPPELVEDKVFMVVPPEAADWAKSAGVPVAPSSYDAIQPPPVDPFVHISSPAIFSDVTGKVQFRGTATGADFDHYRLLVGKGLNPQSWIVVAPDSSTRVEDGLLGTWDTSGLSGLYAIELQVVRTDNRIDTAITQLTIK